MNTTTTSMLIVILAWMLTGCTGIADSFTNNLIVEDCYKMILDGLQVTLLITLCAAVLGTLLGGLVCWMRMNRNAWLRQTARVYIDLMRGMPVLVLLMLMYYVIMAPLDATGIVVPIVMVEGVERTDKRCAIGVQFHPEAAIVKHIGRGVNNANATQFMYYDTAVLLLHSFIDVCRKPAQELHAGGGDISF